MSNYIVKNYLSLAINNEELAQTFINAAAEQERNRIIKLLENLICNNPFCAKFGLMPSHTGCRAVRYHIALIKGENK